MIIIDIEIDEIYNSYKVKRGKYMEFELINSGKIIVVKRDGKKVEFNRAKIALAIKKGFDSIKLDNGENKYTEKDTNKILNKVLTKIEELKPEKIKIEEIQDMIEMSLKEEKYEDVYESFSTYRERRNQSRKLFFDEKKQHKFVKAIENLGMSSQTHEGEIATAMGTMLSYGQTLSNEFSKAYLIKRKYVDSHESGEYYIHDLDYYPMGTTTSCHIDLDKLFNEGFSTGDGYLREPNNIMTYSILTAIAIQANQNDQHGGQSIPHFDYYFAPGVVKTFKKEFKQTVYDYLDYTDFGIFAAVNGMEREIEKITTIKFDVSIFDAYCRDSEQLKRLFRISYEKALKKTEKIVYQAMEAFIHNLNTMRSRAGATLPNSTINLGTDTTPEGRMITKNFLTALEAGIGKNQKPIYPHTIFKVKENINYDKKDPNYDLFQLACKVDSEKQLITFSFLDTEFNKKDYLKNDRDTEVAYMGNSIRVFENIVDKSKSSSTSRGNISTVTINLPRLGLKHGILKNDKVNMKEFYNDLDERMEKAKEMLLDRYEFQADKRVYNFPFLIGQGIWLDSEKLKPADRLRRVNKHGTLAIGFAGLAECLKALTGKHHGESAESQKLGLEIIKHMRDKINEYTENSMLNFVLYETHEKDAIEYFMSIDKSIYGKYKGITDKEKYTDGFSLPEEYNISIKDQLEIESKYHELTNGGHFTKIELGIKAQGNAETFEKTIRQMKEAGIGLGKLVIN